jgi:hypothetical protein
MDIAILDPATPKITSEQRKLYAYAEQQDISPGTDSKNLGFKLRYLLQRTESLIPGALQNSIKTMSTSRGTAYAVLHTTVRNIVHFWTQQHWITPANNQLLPPVQRNQ